MSKDYILLFNIITELNEEFYELTQNDTIIPFRLECTGYTNTIKFLGYRIWDDDNFTISVDLKKLLKNEVMKIVNDIKKAYK